MRDIIINCVECPKGCEIKVKTENDIITVSGNSCPRGRLYAQTEVVCPRRVLTTTVKTSGGVVSVKTDKPVKKAELFDLMEKIKGICVKGEVRIGDVIFNNITEDINLIATDSTVL